MRYKKLPLVEVACAGCGRVQRLRKFKIVPCEFYTCSGWRCKLNPEFELPAPPEGYHYLEIYQAASTFTGHQLEENTPEYLEAVERAKAIRGAGTAEIAEREEHIN